MNILYIVTWYTKYGVTPISEGVFHFEQIQALNKLGQHICLFYPFDTTFNELHSEIENGIEIYRVKYKGNIVSRFFRLKNDLKTINNLHHFDLIHGHVASEAGIISLFSSFILHIPYVITEHNPIEYMNIHSLIGKLKLKFVYKHSKTNLCVSYDQYKKLSLIFPRLKFSVLYNGVLNPTHFLNADRSYRKNGINISIVASFYDKEVKGFQFLLPALQNLLNNNFKIYLHILGDGIYKNYFMSMANNLNIMNNCIFYGNCSKPIVYNIVSQMDFFVSASLFESAGVSVEEALLLGIPVLTTNSGGANSFIDRTNGIVVSRGSITELENGIRKMIDIFSSFNRHVIQCNAYDKFEMTTVSNKHINLYNNVIQKFSKRKNKWK